MGILNVDNIQPVGGGTTITLNSSEINVGAGITFESNGQAIYAGVTTFASNINLGGDVIHSGDNTKIRFPANDTITFETSGSEKLRITSNGKVGIGTINPQQLLEVQDRSGGTLIGLSVGTQYGNAGFGGYNNYPAIMNHVANPLIYCDTNNDRTIFFGDTVGFGTTCAFRVNGAERLRIDSSGNLTKPTSFHILVNRNGDQTGYTATGTTGPIIWNRVITSQSSPNAANHFNTSTGIFTAPVTGYYYFQATVHANFTVQESWLIINGSRQNYSNVQPTRTGTTPASIVITYKLTAGDEVGLKWYENGGTNRTINANDLITWWRIVLLG